MKARVLLGVLLAGVFPVTAATQDVEQPDAGTLAQVMTFRVQPSDAPAFQAMMSEVVKAAGEANLGANYGWSFWNDMFDYTLVFRVSNMAYFDDEEQWMRQFEGTPGQATLTAAFAEMENIEFDVLSNEIVESVNEWTYAPASGYNGAGFVHVDEIWVKSGQASQEKFSELSKELVAVLGEIEFPYQVVGNRVRLGGSGRTVFVTMFDSKDAFYGKNSLENLAMEKGAHERLDALFAQLSEVITGWEHSDMAFVPDMTYLPRQETTSQDRQ